MPNSAQLDGEHRQLLGRHRVGHRLIDVDGGHVVVGGGDGQIGSVDRPAFQPEPLEGLRRGDFVDQVKVDEQDVGFVGRALMDHVAVPDFFREGAGWGGHRVSSPPGRWRP